MCGEATVSYPMRRLALINVPDLLYSVYISLVIVLIFLALSPQMWHWFIFPVFISGVIIGTDLIRWLRGKLPLFSPTGIIGIIGYHFFFVSFLLQIYWDHGMAYVISPLDWRPWLGGMAALNVVGLLAYKIVRNFTIRKKSNPKKRVWLLAPERFIVWLWSALLISLLLQIWVYIRFGGIRGYVLAYETRYTEQGFYGLGWLFTISESFPLLLTMLYAYYARRRKWMRKWISIASFTVIFLLVSFLFGGFRGSRSTIVWRLFWVAGIIHFWVRPLSRKNIIVGLIFLVGFLYFYAFYKDMGTRFFQTVNREGLLALLETSPPGHSFEAIIIDDLSRVNVQSYELYRLMERDINYHYGWGRTYLAGLVTFVPHFVWPNRPVGKTKEGTNLLYGEGSYIPGIFRTSRVFGLAGEAMLNFGIWGVPFAFMFWGWIVGLIDKLIMRLPPNDSRWLLVPFLVMLGFNALQSDSDNLVFFIFKNGLLPFLVVFWGSRRKFLLREGQ